MKKKRGRDSDLMEPLQSEEDREKLPATLEFFEITDPEVCLITNQVDGAALMLRIRS